MKKKAMKHAILTAIVGIGLMVGCYSLFRYMPFRIEGDKWGMFFMLETIIGMLTLFISASFLYDITKDKVGKGRNG